MNVFLSGIGGIGMANFAVLLKEAGYQVTGSDGAVYEPAATILRNAGIPVRTPYDAANVSRDGSAIIIGNVQSRGHPEVEAALELGADLYSFPEFLHRNILRGRQVTVVAGTHGKSTTAACLSHVLSSAGVDAGFLVGALPVDRTTGAHLGRAGGPFVIEGDEYDSAFFDKRSKFLHYFPQMVVLGTVEYDHADIFLDREAMLVAFRRLIQLLPRSGRLVYAGGCETTSELAKAAPCPTIRVGTRENADWCLLPNSTGLSFRAPDGSLHDCSFLLPGECNRFNGLMALAAAQVMGVPLECALPGLETFKGIRRRLEKLLGLPRLTVYDDFAHHPTAIAASLQAVRESHSGWRVIAVFEPRSNTMVRNVFQRELPQALRAADTVVIGDLHRPERIPERERLDVQAIRLELEQWGVGCKQTGNRDVPSCVAGLLTTDPTVVIFMSNGSFDGAPHDFVRLVQAG